MPITPHTVSAFDDEMNRIRGLLSEMGTRGEDAVVGAMTALQRLDHELAAEVTRGDKAIDALETEVENMVVRTIALRAPMADDLRELIAALKMSAVLERVGDYAKSIAKRVRRMNDLPFLEDDSGLMRMGRIAADMVRTVVEAHALRDVDLARAVSRRDDELDQLYRDLFVDFVAYLAKNPDKANEVANLLFVSKNLERIGDHATTCAEMIYYIMTGDTLPDHEGF